MSIIIFSLFILNLWPRFICSAGETYAIVTLIASDETFGYIAGALALAQSLIDVGSSIERLAMVTSSLSASSRKKLANFYKVIEVEEIHCRHVVANISQTSDATVYWGHTVSEVYGTTCTKFRAWGLPYDRVIFIDSDMLVIGPIDDLFTKYIKKHFYAAPCTLPPDKFNSGFLVLQPCEATMQELIALNEQYGSVDGGDQGLLNDVYCPEWHEADDASQRCGRLPWRYNIHANLAQDHIKSQTSLGYTHSLPTVVHFSGPTKPWLALAYEYRQPPDGKAPPGMSDLPYQIEMNQRWREAYFKAEGIKEPPPNRVLNSLRR